MHANSVYWSFDDLIITTQPTATPVVKYKVSFYDRDGDSVCEDQEFVALSLAKACAEDKLKEATSRDYPPVKAVISQLIGTLTVETERTLSHWS